MYISCVQCSYYTGMFLLSNTISVYIHVYTCTSIFRFEGGLVEHSLRLSEGFAAVLELCDLMSTTREPW